MRLLFFSANDIPGSIIFYLVFKMMKKSSCWVCLIENVSYKYYYFFARKILVGSTCVGFHKMICLEWNKKNEWCKMLQATSRTMTFPRKLIEPKQIRTCKNYLLVFIETRFSTFLATSTYCFLNLKTTTNAERPSKTKIIKSCSSQKSKSRNEPMPATSKCSRRVSHPVIGV